MIDLIAKILSYTVYTPRQVCIGVCHIDTDPPGKISGIPNIGMPWMGNGATLSVSCQETERRRCINGGITVGQIDAHLKSRGKNRGISDTPFTEVLPIVNPADAAQLIAHPIGRRQSGPITPNHLHSMPRRPSRRSSSRCHSYRSRRLRPLNELTANCSLSLIRQHSLSNLLTFSPSLHPGKGSGIKNILSPLLTL